MDNVVIDNISQVRNPTHAFDLPRECIAKIWAKCPPSTGPDYFVKLWALDRIRHNESERTRRRLDPDEQTDFENIYRAWFNLPSLDLDTVNHYHQLWS